MTERVQALVVHHNSETLATLEGALERQGMHILHAQSRAQAKHILSGLAPAPLVFTETQLPDGTWTDILAVAGKAAQPVNVIVVGRVVDTRFYVEAIQAGAFDFLVPPFAATDLAYVVRSALDNVAARRAARRPPLQSAEGAAFADAGHRSDQVAV